jgi:predicted lipid-binding transport protein (Tim44 family)
MIKKLLAVFVAMMVMFSPIGNIVVQDLHQTEVSAKKYRSGTKRYNNNNTTTNPNQNVNQNNTVNNRTNATTPRNNGGLMRGIMYGGLAGLLFGGLLAGMGGLGPILGMAINIIGILLLFMLISRVITAFKKKQREDNDPWHR